MSRRQGHERHALDRVHRGDRPDGLEQSWDEVDLDVEAVQ